MKKKIFVFITTYNRPDSLSKLLKQILSEKNKYKHKYDIAVYIIDDCSSNSYSAIIKSFQKELDVIYHRLSFNHGRQKYWKLINIIYTRLKTIDFDYFFQMPDDDVLINDFFDKAINIYERIDDPKKICLNVAVSHERYKVSCWTKKIPEIKKFIYNEENGENGKNELQVIDSGWLDMDFMCTKKFFEVLKYNILPIHHDRWILIPYASSGVGMQISQRIIREQYNMYQVDSSLITQLEHVSVMKINDKLNFHEVFKIDDINDFDFKSDLKTANIASVPERESSLIDTVKSIINQVDYINLFLNGYKTIPVELVNSKINVYTSQEYNTDKGDAGKFFMSGKSQGYFFTLDDDIIYPEDYIKKLTGKIDYYNRKAIVSFHGRIMNDLPVDSYYQNKKEHFHCLDKTDADRYVHFPGTGVMGYHASVFDNNDIPKLSYDDFSDSNMADIFVGIKAQKHNIPVVVASHDKDWIKLNPKVDLLKTIYNTHRKKDTIQTQLVNNLGKLNINRCNDHKMIIIATGYNSGNYIHEFYKSIINTNYKGDYRCIMISDGSDDEITNKILNSIHQDNNIKVNIYAENKGACFRRHEIIKSLNLNDQDIILFTGLDDKLLPDALDKIQEQYDKGKWMSYGNWMDQHGNINSIYLDFDATTHANTDYRKKRYISTAINTFKYFIYKNITEEDLKINGEFPKACTEVEVMISCLEMCGKNKIGIITEPIYIYNRHNNGTQARFGQEYKDDMVNLIRSKPKKQLLETV